jgi:hypothetical protein
MNRIASDLSPGERSCGPSWTWIVRESAQDTLFRVAPAIRDATGMLRRRLVPIRIATADAILL